MLHLNPIPTYCSTYTNLNPSAPTSMSQIVQVVSMLLVPRRLGSWSFQSNEVKGAQNSLLLF